MGQILLVRHGQAGFGTDDYDRLSDLGHEQARLLGYAWEASGWLPTRVLTGAMTRHHQTAVDLVDGCGFDDLYDVDARWDELDHEAIVEAHDPGFSTDDPRAFQATFVAALDAWRGGSLDVEEPWDAFAARVRAAFADVVARTGSGESSVVVTSGGPIALVTSDLLAGDDSLWPTVNTVVANTGLTTVVTGRSGTSLITFNAMGHLPADAVTYR